MEQAVETQQQVACAQCDTLNRVAANKPAALARCGKCKSALLDGGTVQLRAENFQTHVERSSIPILVDFWAPWCAPCRMMAPVLEQAAQRFATKLRVGKLNTEAEPGIAARHAVRGIPTLALFRQGSEIARHVGATDLNRLMAWIDANLPRAT